ncbi:MAG: hypothetical protein PHG92_04625 [Patescibacteria group bacterium]|nr:hypothetical protein [Patescibacteria group bacterium]
MKAYPISQLLSSTVGTNPTQIISPRYFGCELQGITKGIAWGWKNDEEKIVIYDWSWTLEPEKNEFTYMRGHKYCGVPDTLVEEFPTT